MLKAAKAANAVDNAIDAAKIVNKVDNAVDASKLTNKIGDAANIVGDVCSFSEDTKISTPEGYKNISAIEVGDHVLAWNKANGTFGYYEVTDTFSHTDKVLTELVVDGERIETTPEHPFYVEGKGWTPAEDLRMGDEIRQADGTTGWVWLKWNVYKTQEMYNLTVDTAHTFFVGEGQWLVHNACDPSDIRKIEQHLQRFDFDPPTNEMVERLKDGHWTPWDKNFAEHELLEKELIDRGLDYDIAHPFALESKGISYQKGYEAYIYHPSVIKKYPDYFNSATNITTTFRVTTTF